MKKILAILFAGLLLNCGQHDLDDREQVKQNVERIFGFNFPSSQDWCTTVSDKITFIKFPKSFLFLIILKK